jgi:NAD(P)-dependent dehydrogenase (short-subunit alcohol dehydrogenase family)
MKLNSGRRQLLQTGIASVAGAATVELTKMGTVNAQTESAPEDTNAKNRFAQKVVLITGATSGIGRAAAIAFAREGAKVGLCGRRKAMGAEVEQIIRDRGGDATYIKADVTQPKEVESFVNGIVKKYGRLDVAFNNAGDVLSKPLHEMTIDEWDWVQNTNLRGVFLAMKYQIPYMLERGDSIYQYIPDCPKFCVEQTAI